jgi:hypothetical protein
MNAIYNDTESYKIIKNSKDAKVDTFSIQNLKENPGIPICSVQFGYHSGDDPHEFTIKVNAHTGAIIR